MRAAILPPKVSRSALPNCPIKPVGGSCRLSAGGQQRRRRQRPLEIKQQGTFAATGNGVFGRPLIAHERAHPLKAISIIIYPTESNVALTLNAAVWMRRRGFRSRTNLAERRDGPDGQRWSAIQNRHSDDPDLFRYFRVSFAKHLPFLHGRSSISMRIHSP